MSYKRIAVFMMFLVLAALKASAASSHSADVTPFVMTCEFPSSGETGNCTEETIGSLTLVQTKFVAGVRHPCFLDGESSTLTASDGSEIFFQAAGPQCDGPEHFLRKQVFQITGGSGQFAAATGSGTYTETGDFPEAPAVSHATGTISVPNNN